MFRTDFSFGPQIFIYDMTLFLSVFLAKNVFRVSSTDASHCQTHTLHVSDVYHKQQWLNSLRTAMTQQQGGSANARDGEPVPAKRRSAARICDAKTDENCPPASGPKLRRQTLSKSRLDQKLNEPQKRKETKV